MTTVFKPSCEQKAIIEADLVGQRVIACAGSGKTATAVRRLAETRRMMGKSRQYACLLSYSNVAVDTFRSEFSALNAGKKSTTSSRVLICTVDSFVTSHILSHHAASIMKCTKRPFLVQGHEPFLKGFTFFNGTYPEGIEKLSATLSATGDWQYFNTALHGASAVVENSIALAAINKLGKSGAYTYNLGRFWALKTLVEKPHLLKVLSQRYPYILVDEAQDISNLHGTLLELLIEAGSVVSLVGDPNQAIYEFANADGSFLRDFDPGAGGQTLPLSQNRRSIQALVDVTNKLSGTNYRATRHTPTRKCGPFILIYKDTEIPNVRSIFADILLTNGYRYDSAAIICRGRGTVQRIAGNCDKWGAGATEYFALAAICRDRTADIADAFVHTVDGVFRLLAAPPLALRTSVVNGTNEFCAKKLRRLIWEFLRSSAQGLPLATRSAKSDWQPKLKMNLGTLLTRIETQCGLPRNVNWTRSVTTRSLADFPLWKQETVIDKAPLPEVKTVHQVKGLSIDAVLYLLRPKDIKKLLEGPVDEEGRIAYVGLTRAKDLLLVAVPSTTKPDVLAKLRVAGFVDWS